MLRFVLSFLLVLATSNALPVPPGVAAGLYSDMVAKSDFTLNLQPPVENAEDVSNRLDTVLAVEESQNRGAFADFATQKQHMLNVEKSEIARLVRAAYSARSRAAGFLELEPAAVLAAQPVWQAGEPIPVIVSFDVPAYGASDALSKLSVATAVEAELAKKHGGGVLALCMFIHCV
jgi:hypothetical protein